MLDLRDDPDEAAFRARLREWFAANLPAGWADRDPTVGLEDVDFLRDWTPPALRRRVRRHHLADGVRRPRPAAGVPGHLPGGVGPARRTRSRRGDRPRHGRADDHGVGEHRAEGALPAPTAVRRGDLVPGLLRARRRLRPRLAAHQGRARRRQLGGQRAEGVVLVRARRGLVPAAVPHRPGAGAAPRALVPARRHARARCRGAAAAADHRRPRVQRDLLDRRPGAARLDARGAGAGVGRRDDHAAARARHAGLRADGAARAAAVPAGGDGPDDPAPGRLPRGGRPVRARPGRGAVDRPAGAADHQLPLDRRAAAHRRAGAGGLDRQAALVGGQPAADRAGPRAARRRRAARRHASGATSTCARAGTRSRRGRRRSCAASSPSASSACPGRGRRRRAWTSP